MLQVLTTPRVDNAIVTDPGFAPFIGECLGRFSRGDWGKLSEPDREANRRAELTGAQVLAAYPLPDHLAHHRGHSDSKASLWVAKNPGHTGGPPVFTVLFPGEY